MEIRKRTLEIYARSDKQLGVRKMTHCLAREHCVTVSEGWVYQLMRQMKLLKMSTMKPLKAASGKENVIVCWNLLSQRFDSKALNLVWVCDFTCVKVSGRLFHICVILDFYVGKVIACRVGSKFDRFPAIDILWDAVRLRGVSKGLMFHADQGTQFTSRDFRMVIDELGMVQSFSAKGHPYNNAVMECFFKYLKKEKLDRRCFQSLEQFKWSLLPCISGFFIPPLPHPRSVSRPG